jgi:hypothetical protein
MKKIILGLIVLQFYSCVHDKLIKASAENDEIKVNCYYYSYISSGSPDFIEVIKNDSTVIILKSKYGFQDLKIQNDTIIISHLEFQNKNEIQRMEPIFKYKIKYEVVSSHEMYLKYEENKTILETD